jgi:hypothetical protein
MSHAAPFYPLSSGATPMTKPSPAPAAGSRGHLIPGGTIRISPVPVRIGTPSPEGHTRPVRVELLSSGNEQVIHVHCRCGEQIAIACELADDA